MKKIMEGRNKVGMTANVKKTEYIVVTRAGMVDSRDTLVIFSYFLVKILLSVALAGF